MAVKENGDSWKQASPDLIKTLKSKIERNVGKQCGLEDIYQDNSWDDQVDNLSTLGDYFNIGKLMLGYVDKGDANDYIVLVRENTTVIVIDPKCPRDKILQVLSD
jgi:hypothetical protein